jgi:hypothetical protein
MADPVIPNPEKDLQTVTVIAKGVDPAASADDRLETAKLVNQQIDMTKQGHLNTQMQILPMLGAFFGGNAKEALRYYNGGPTRQEEAFHPTLGRFIQERNMNGVTGRVFNTNGKELSPDEIEKLDRSGGLMSESNKTAMYTGTFQGASDAQKTLMTGMNARVANAYANAVDTAKKGSVLSETLENQRRILTTKENQAWLNALNSLPIADRQKLFGFISSQSGVSTGKSAEASSRQGAQVGGQESLTRSISGDIGFGGRAGTGEGGVGVAPPKVGVGVSAGQSRTAGTQYSATAGTGATAAETESQQQQVQRNVQSEIRRILQGKIENAQQFQDLTNLALYEAQINQINSSIAPENQAPGVREPIQVDSTMSGPMVGVLNSMNTQRNIALNSSFANFMAQAIHKTIGSTEPKTDQEWREEFQKSQTYKAINNTYDQKMDAVKNNRKFTPEEGAVYVNKNNRLVRWVDGDWEPVNAKK